MPFEQHTKNYLSRYRREISEMLCIYTAGIFTQVCDGAGAGTGTGIGTTLIPVQDTSVSSVRRNYRYWRLL